MTQTLILLCTLAAMAGLCIGYFLGWLDTIVQPFVDVLWGIYTCERERQKAISNWIAYVTLIEVTADKPAAQGVSA